MTRTLPAFLRSEAPANLSQRTLTFAERVAYQHAIEDVYSRHRIWPKKRPDPKPSLDAVMSQRQLQKKVEDYLRKSQALEDYWQRPITAEHLQAEMDRMASHTKRPEVLRELFAALGNDPFVVAECLGRPVLTERLLADSTGELVKQLSRTCSPIVASTASYTLPTISAGVVCVDAWAATSTTNAPTARFYHTAVWTGNEMITWGGTQDIFTGLNTGGRYNPTTDTWANTSMNNAPAGRYNHSAVWTGNEMIVWGGTDMLNYLNTGGRYNPGTDSWSDMSTISAPSARDLHTAVWTGNEMIVWGGTTNGVYFNTGGRYDPSTNSWTAISATNAPSGRSLHTAVWTGTDMIIWGGANSSQYFNTGGRYNPGTNSWTATSTANVPGGRFDHTAVWTGIEMIVWGGVNYINPVTYYNTGGRYDPGTDSWTATSTTNVPGGRFDHTAVWTGTEMIVWGGAANGVYFDTGGRYDPSPNSWTATSTANAPTARYAHTSVWSGTEMIVWGGDNATTSFNTGGRYCVAQPSPTPTPRIAPTPRPPPTPAPRP